LSARKVDFLKLLLFGGLVGLVCLCNPACEKKPEYPIFNNPLDPDVEFSEVIPVPGPISVEVTENSVSLRWEVPDTTWPGKYRVFRAEGDTGTARAIADVDTTIYVDRDVSSGRTYFYQVAALDTRGREGELSRKVSATPSLFSINIESGAEATNELKVRISLNAPPGTPWVIVGNDSTFDGSAWQTYRNEVTWTLPSGDGSKAVWARFKGPGGELSPKVADRIILDTRARIEWIDFHPKRPLYSTGDSIHIALQSGEAYGEAFFELGTGGEQGDLLDDGTGGDTAPHNGIYERDYVIPPGVEGEKLSLTGHFKDKLGNIASPVIAQKTLTVHSLPEAVTLLSVRASDDPDSSFLMISWTKSNDPDFSLYRLYRASGGGAVDSASLPVVEIRDASRTFYKDLSVFENETYCYAVYVADSFGYSEGSNSLCGVPNDPPPEAVRLNQASSITDSSAVLSWSETDEDDFAEYALFRSEGSGVDTSSTLVFAAREKSVTSYRDRGLQENTEYFYKVYVKDESGQVSGSNEVSVETRNRKPQPSRFTRIESSPDKLEISLTWESSQASDFSRYDLRRSDSGPVSEQSALVGSFESASDTTYTDVDLADSTTYYYRVYTYDEDGLFAASEQVQAITRNVEPPAPVTLNQPAQVDTFSMTLTWSQADEKDFERYELYRSDSPGVDSSAHLVATARERDITFATDTGLESGTRYYYRVYTWDEGGKFSASNEVFATTLNDKPDPPRFTAVTSSPEKLEITLNWTRSEAKDFSRYELRRSEGGYVDETSTLVGSFDNVSDTTFTDTGLADTTSYYYRIYTYDQDGLSAGSDQLEVRTRNINPPSPVQLDQPSQVDTFSVSLSWSKSNEKDFDRYELYRSLTPGVSTSAAKVFTSCTGEITYATDSGLEAATRYYYRVYTWDEGGKFSASNEVFATTLNSPPDAVEVVSVGPAPGDTCGSLEILWRSSDARDFASYKLFRSETPAVSSELSELVATVTGRTDTSFVDAGLQDNSEYYYKVYVYDDAGLSAGSPRASGTTANCPPGPVSISSAVFDTASVTLQWTQSQAHDFDSYVVERSLASDFSNPAALGSIPFVEQVTYVDTAFDTTVTHNYYRVGVRDKGGLTTYSQPRPVKVK